MMAAWSFRTEETEQKASVPADEPAWVTDLDAHGVQVQEQPTGQDCPRGAIEDT